MCDNSNYKKTWNKSKLLYYRTENGPWFLSNKQSVKARELQTLFNL